MVELNVPTCRFGRPDPDHPQPHYPGVSATRFDPSGALKIYKDVIHKEKQLRSLGQALRHKQQHNPLDETVADHLGDTLPGRSSIARVYRRMGYTVMPTSGRPIPPNLESNSLPQSSRRTKSSAHVYKSKSAEDPRILEFRKQRGHSCLSASAPNLKLLSKAGVTADPSSSTSNLSVRFPGKPSVVAGGADEGSQVSCAAPAPSTISTSRCFEAAASKMLKPNGSALGVTAPICAAVSDGDDDDDDNNRARRAILDKCGMWNKKLALL